MNPHVTKGSSFKGVFDYLLHDKEGGQEQALEKILGERVTGVWTHNLATDDPYEARNQMIDVAVHADDLKKAKRLNRVT